MLFDFTLRHLSRSEFGINLHCPHPASNRRASDRGCNQPAITKATMSVKIMKPTPNTNSEDVGAHKDQPCRDQSETDDSHQQRHHNPVQERHSGRIHQ